MSASITSNMTSKGQVTIPAALRQSFGFKAGAAVEFFHAGTYVGVRPVQSVSQEPKSGFGMIKAKVKQVSADFDVATLLAKNNKYAKNNTSKRT